MGCDWRKASPWYVKNPRSRRLVVGYTSCGARLVILSKSKCESSSAKAWSFVDIHSVSISRSCSAAIRRQRLSTFIVAPRIVPLVIPCTKMRLSMCITFFLPFQYLPQYSRACSTAWISLVFMCSQVLDRYREIDMVKTAPGNGCGSVMFEVWEVSLSDLVVGILV